jgi:hypothetical protein
VELEDLRERAKARLQQLSAQPNDGLDAFQRDALAFFSRVPEPPLYRRRDDPSRALATTLLEEGEVLLARSWRLGSEVADFSVAVEAHLVALVRLSAGKVELAEPAWHEALAKERVAAAPLRLWNRTDAVRPPVFAPSTGHSRFDPRPEGQVEAKLVCPGCRKVSQFHLSPLVATHQLLCTHCAALFTAYVAEVRTLEVQSLGRNRRRYRFRVDELAGLQTMVEFDDATPGELSAARRDLLAFLYLPKGNLRGVLNLNSSRVLWVSSPGACFVATVAFGEGAPELDVLRGFRDRVLMASGAGRAFVAWYYREGPGLARVVQRAPGLRGVTRVVLQGVVALLERT